MCESVVRAPAFGVKPVPLSGTSPTRDEPLSYFIGMKRAMGYSYAFPKELIAQQPAAPRDAARLLVYNRSTKKVSYSTFRSIGDFLPKRAVLVFNDTRVVPARIQVRKATGGRVDMLYIARNRNTWQVLADRKLAVGSKVAISSAYFFTVLHSDGRYYYLRPSFGMSRTSGILERYGRTPLPPYIKAEGSDKRLRAQYQAVFAEHNGSIAAPTASLHVTKKLLGQLKGKGFDCVFVTLHVGLGTFAPVTDEQMRRGALHTERYVIDSKVARFLDTARKQKRPIIAVGTTVVRTLESAADAKGRIRKRSGETKLFVRPGYTFKIIDGMITNFHVPHSSLLMLVSALVGKKKIFELYRKAIRRKFRLFSFGDGMLLY